MWDFLFLMFHCFTEFNFFVWLHDIWDVTIDLSISMTFFRTMTMLYTLFQPVDGKITQKYSTRFIKIWEFVFVFSESSCQILALGCYHRSFRDIENYLNFFIKIQSLLTLSKVTKLIFLNESRMWIPCWFFLVKRVYQWKHVTYCIFAIGLLQHLKCLMGQDLFFL